MPQQAGDEEARDLGQVVLLDELQGPYSDRAVRRLAPENSLLGEDLLPMVNDVVVSRLR